MKKMWKKFWTLSKRQSSGFTLVELIVVIAILAILAGVGVPVYSGYVAKANMQADASLVSEVEHALTLAYYSGKLSDDGYVILSNAAPDTGDNAEVEAALEAAFGSGWENLTLSYDGWAVSPTFSLLTAEAAELVANSSFVTGSTPAVLMENVSSMTNAMASVLDNKDDAVATITNNLSPDSIAAIKTQLGVNDLADLNNTELSNFMVLAVANEMSELENIEDASSLASLVLGYAAYSGYAYSEYASAEDKAAYLAMNSAISNASNAGNEDVSQYVLEQLDAFYEKIDEDSLTKYVENGNEEVDVGAVMKMMAALNEGSNNITMEDLGNDALATEGVLGDYFNQYVNAALALAGAGEIPELASGEVAVLFNVADGIAIYSTLN